LTALPTVRKPPAGLHFFNVKPYPSGQQYTGISVAHAAVSNIPEHAINNATAADEVALPSLMAPLAGTCGNPPVRQLRYQF